MIDGSDPGQSADFDGAAQHLLRGLHAFLEGEFDAADTHAEVTRASVHVVSPTGWRQLAVCDFHSGITGDGQRLEARRSSTLWSLIARHACPVGIVTVTRSVRIFAGDRFEERVEPQLEPHALQATFHQNTNTHALGIPLAGRSGAPEGMVVLEATARNVVEHLDWERWLAPLCRAADAQAARLLAPQAPAGAPRGAAAPRAPDTGVVLGSSTLVTTFARLPDPLLITGPTGTGKTYLARAIHELSGREGAFVPFSVASVPADLQAAYFVGWKRGAFSHALSDYSGALTQAAGGTLFIDEVDKLPLDVQKQLLQLTDREQTYSPLASGQSIPITVRFVFATNANLAELRREGRFYNDLYYRISRFPIAMLPLAERRHELSDWCDRMLEGIHKDMRAANVTLADGCRLAPDALQRLAAYDWPGNLRELDTILRRAYVAADTGTQIVNIDEGAVRRAFSWDQRDGHNSVERDLESVARKLLAMGQETIQQWRPGELPPKQLDEANPSITSYVRDTNVLGAYVVRAAQQALGPTASPELARVLGKQNAYEGGNLATFLKRAAQELESFKSRLYGSLH